jgi:hypothetical protein
MNKYDLIDSFFYDQKEYIEFLVMNKSLMKASNSSSCFAKIEKKEGVYLYILQWLKDGRYIGDYITPFRASQENIELFNKGCKILAERLEIYLDTNDSSKVPEFPPAFGVLTAVVE